MKFLSNLLTLSVLLIWLSGCTKMNASGIYIEGITRISDGGAQKTYNYRTSMDKGRLRQETKGTDSGQVVIFRTDTSKLWIIDELKKTYTEITAEDIKKLGEKIDNAMAQMHEQMKNLPPAQKKMMEQMMKGQMGGMQKPEPPVYKSISDSEKVKDWTCRHYEVLAGGQKQSEVWLTDWNALGLKAEDFSVYTEMAKLMGKLGSRFGSLGTPGAQTDEKSVLSSGYPVKQVWFAEGKSSQEFALETVTRKSIPDSDFELPPGFKKIDFQK